MKLSPHQFSVEMHKVHDGNSRILSAKDSQYIDLSLGFEMVLYYELAKMGIIKKVSAPYARKNNDEAIAFHLSIMTEAVS